ncbi:Zinc finger BED domain-containing protein 5 [Eumeta japonica]|uniref:Zinc finger BED domain-containing protein 5 n=1 Tax=Eumeta variegata TaxID=151549 RepID=A0A4C1UDU7_EUMVA|nr:Zinc finger BED domain-containing protein 5 [Eumeta japonica]
MAEELQSFHDNDAWKVVDRPSDARVVQCKWVYKKKLNCDNAVRYRARLVAKGFTQVEDVKRVATSSNDAEYLKAVRAGNTAITDPDDDATTSSSTVLKTKKRKHDESYISFGLVDSNGSTLCILCSKLLPNSSMAPAKLCRHLETVHPESKDKNKEFFVHKKNSYWKVKKV